MRSAYALSQKVASGIQREWVSSPATRLALANGLGLWYAYLIGKAQTAREKPSEGFSVDMWRRLTNSDTEFVLRIFSLWHPGEPELIEN